ncbi:unnamed protein product, partial [Symbiodinium necroappetens]
MSRWLRSPLLRNKQGLMAWWLTASATLLQAVAAQSSWQIWGTEVFAEFLESAGCEQCSYLLSEPTRQARFEVSSNIFGCADIDVLLPSIHWLYQAARQRNGGIPPGLLVDGGANVGRATARWIASFGDAFGRRVSRNDSHASCVVCAGADASEAAGGLETPTVVVVAVEPSASNFKLLLQHAVEHSWNEEGFLPLEAALSDVAGHAQLAVSKDFSIDEIATLLWKDGDHRDKQPVEVITLSRVVAEAKAAFPGLGRDADKIYLLKLDIEGSEPAVLRSLAAGDPPVKFVSFEYASNVWKDKLPHVIEDLFRAKYFCFLITSEHLFPVSGPFWSNAFEIPMWSNFFCGRDGDPDLEVLVQLHLGAVGLWPRMPGMYLAGFAGRDQHTSGLLEAQHACTDLGAACAGVTCERPASGIAGEEPGGCSVRMGIEGLRRSPFGEVTYLKSLAHANLFLRPSQRTKHVQLQRRAAIAPRDVCGQRSRGILFLAFVTLHHPDAADAGSSGSAAAAAVWQRLTELVQRPAEAQDEASYWSRALTTLHSEHPHPDVSGVLAWLYLFGLPSTAQPLVQRDVNTAIRIAREGVHHAPPCARCYALLGLLLGVGYPPLVGAAHLAQDGTGDPRLLILGDVLAQGPATADAARLPRDIGPPDPSAAAYALSYAGGDPLGMLAVAYLNRTRMINLTKLTAPGPNQASSLLSRMPKTVDKASCDETLVNSLGNLAASTIDEIQSGSWGPVPDPLSQGLSQQRADKAFLEHILADTSRSSASDLAKASSMLETGGFRSEELPAVARKAANVSELRSLAASKGDRKSALWLAVEHLQENDTQKAKPLLDMVVTKAAQDADHDADAEMAKYYLARFASPNSSDVTIARRDAWPHLVQAADLGREDAKLLVAHAFVDGSDDLETPEGSSSNTEAIRRYKQLLPEAPGKSDKPNVTFPASSAPSRRNGALNPVQAFAAYNLGVLSLKDSEGGSSASPVPSELPSASSGICSPEVQGSFLEVVLSQSGIVRLIIALGRRSARLGDEIGALLLAMLLSDIGHDLGHADAAFLWDKWAAHQPPHLVLISDVQTHDNKQAHHPCNLRGWWTTSSPDLVSRNVSLVYAADVMGGGPALGRMRETHMWQQACGTKQRGTEMFNASLADSHLLQGLEATEIVQPIPEKTEFRHLYSFLWHTSYDAFPAGAPVPVALQPPGAVPHLLEFHHQRGKLLMDKSCNTAVVEGMYVNWTFHRLDAEPASEA